MTTAYTTLLGLALPVQGELQGTWGDEVNNYITNYLDAAVAGTQTISGSQTAVTLSKTTGSSLSQAGSGATGSSQYFVINCTGNPAGTLTITAPAASKAYLIINATSTTQDVKIVGAGPTTGVTLVSGERAIVSWNGSDFVKVANFGGVGSFTTISATTGNITTVNSTTVDTTNIEVTNIKAKDGTASASIADSTGAFSVSAAFAANGNTTLGDAVGDLVTVNGTTTFVNANPTLSAGTANGVLYLDGSKVATSGSALTFDGTNLSSTGGATFLGSPSGFGGGEIRLGPTTADTQSAISTQSTGTPQLIFDHRGMSNTGVFIWRNGTGGGSEQMRLTSTGLGIGTSSPGSRLHIYQTGSTQAGLIETNQTASVLNFKNTSQPSGQPQIGAAGSDLILNTNGSERARIDSSGNLGLGVTPSASASWINFQTQRAVVTGGANDRNESSYNSYRTSGQYTYIGSDFATMHQQISGQHLWFTAPSGTAGNAISFTQALTLDANRNLLLNGTTAGASAVGTLAIFNGTAPTGSVTDGIILYAEDVSSSSELKVRDEAGNVTTLSPHNFSLIPEGPSEEMAWAYYSEKGGKRINVDMLKLARMVENLTGEKLVYES